MCVSIVCGWNTGFESTTARPRLMAWKFTFQRPSKAFHMRFGMIDNDECMWLCWVNKNANKPRNICCADCKMQLIQKGSKEMKTSSILFPRLNIEKWFLFFAEFRNRRPSKMHASRWKLCSSQPTLSKIRLWWLWWRVRADNLVLEHEPSSVERQRADKREEFASKI